ncbi:MAG: hypothetical protein HYS08_06920 [Chlamydiae bacterium]|nr:hypothetical protein [Chlamydiota bacterium]MBI3265562.1 hypothetical protein [Chlamydiota bacterium]
MRRRISSLNPDFAIGRGIRRNILGYLAFRNARQASFYAYLRFLQANPTGTAKACLAQALALEFSRLL